MTTATGSSHLELTVSNLGPIAEGKIELRPMSVFVGPSNTGKSYLATLIYALHRFFSAHAGTSDIHNTSDLPFALGPHPTILPRRDNLSEGDMKALYTWAEENVPKIEDGRFRWVTNSAIPESIAVLLKPAFGVLSQYSKFLDSDIARCFGVNQSAGLVRYPGNEAGLVLLGNYTKERDANAPFSYEVAITESGASLSMEIAEEKPLQIDWDNNTIGVHIVNIPWHVLGYTISNSDAKDDPRQLVANTLLGTIAKAVISATVDPFNSPAHYLPTDRAGALRSHQKLVGILIANASRTAAPVASRHPTFSGVYGDFLERLVTLGYSSAQRERLGHPLALNLERDILGGAIRIESSPVGYPSFLYRPEGWERDLPLMNTSSMVSELAPVVLYLRHVVEPGDTLIIEEPESHLHPAMQVEFVRLLAAAVKAGIRIIITTHSEWVLEELANLVLMSELPVEHRAGMEGADLAFTPDEVGAWFFEPDYERGGSVVKEIPLDKEMGKFPSEFGLVTAELYNRFAKISNRIERLTEE